MPELSREDLLLKIDDLEMRLAESEQLIEAIKAGEVDAFALNTNAVPEVYTLQSGDYAYRLLIEEFGEGALNLTEDGLIVYTNTYFCELLHVKYEDVIGRKIFDFVDDGSRASFKDLFSQSLSGNSKGELNLCVKGKLVPVYISLTSLQPKLATIGMIITDLTLTKEHEAIVNNYQRDLETKNIALEQSNRELDSFTYIASHDLQEPLRKIQTFCQFIMENPSQELSEINIQYFERVVNASQRMKQLINSLLEYSRMKSSAIEKQIIDLNGLLEEVIRDLGMDDKNTGTIITIEKLPTVMGIYDQYRQLFTNLLSNANKYKKADTPLQIKISFQRENGFFKITVSDNGIGFEPQYAKKIFELFQRLHSRFEYEGTGIGLAICKKIVQTHGGFMKAIGVPGKGASFEIYLPESNI